jgi:hypothetical protein
MILSPAPSEIKLADALFVALRNAGELSLVSRLSD